MTKPKKTAKKPTGIPVSEASWRALLEAYRLHPGQHVTASKLAGLNYRTCRKGWEVGLGGRPPISTLVAAPTSSPLQRAALLRGAALWAAGGGASEAGGANAAGEAGGPAPGHPGDEAGRFGRADALAILERLARIRASELALLDETRENAAALQAALGASRDELVAIGRAIKVALGRIARGERAPEGDAFDLREALAALRTFATLGRLGAQQVKLALEAERIVLADLLSYAAEVKPGGEGDGGESDEDDETSDEELLAQLEADAAAGGSAKQLERIKGRQDGGEHAPI